ncbi:hypothetical protein TPY_0041 [Sulfobacillus acidophilus TPY]|nr:hypothetical protein TPY_0041 [Sulfobacillus acidophilus TPY]
MTWCIPLYPNGIQPLLATNNTTFPSDRRETKLQRRSDPWTGSPSGQAVPKDRNGPNNDFWNF